MEQLRRSSPVRGRTGETLKDVVERVEAYLRANPDAPVPLSTLCHITGYSERGLRNAFYGVHGMSPKRWMLHERLGRAHRALREAEQGATTVTAVAIDHGFYQLGRFAVTYRKAFGEAPSETLRGGGRKSLPLT
jgi:AraC family ethanolamine operon transcriptional activator